MGSLIGQRIRLLLGIAVVLMGLWFVYTIRGILAPFVLAFIFAYVLTPLVDRMEARGLKRLPSILLIFLLVFASLATLIVTVGRTMTEEMVDLSGEFLRQESRDVSITVTNLDKKVSPLAIATSSSGKDNPFVLLHPADGRAILQPGGQAVIHVRFAPGNTLPVEGAVQVGFDGIPGVIYDIPMTGNPRSGTKTPSSQQVSWGKLTFSVSRIDFGDAGPNIVSQISVLVAQFEPQVQSLLGQELDLAALIKTYGSRLIEVLLGRTTQLLSGVVSGLMLLVIVPIVTFFFLKEGRRITHGMIELVPNGYFEITLNLMHSINNSIGGYIRGQLLAVAVVAALSVIGLSLIDMNYALPVGVVAGLANMIPYLGPLIGIFSASVVALATLGGSAMVTKVFILFLFIQIIDNVLIQPMVVAKSVDLHPLVVMVVVMIGSDLWGMVGMLVAVPVTGILKVSGQTLYEGLRGYRVT
jgi:predicted PurR-regulated permease PerM